MRNPKHAQCFQKSSFTIRLLSKPCQAATIKGHVPNRKMPCCEPGSLSAHKISVAWIIGNSMRYHDAEVACPCVTTIKSNLLRAFCMTQSMIQAWCG